MRTLLREGSLPDTDEDIGKRRKLDLDTRDWSVPGEDVPSEARARARRLFDDLRIELERVVGRRLYLDELGSQAKYTVGNIGEPIVLHLDARHEAFAFRFYGQERTRRSLAWLLYLSDDGWGEPEGSGSGGTLRAYPRPDCAGLKCGEHEGNLQVGWLERGRGSEPVFLDCWVMPASMEGRTLAELRRSLAEELDDDAEVWSGLFENQPSYVLYCVGADGAREDLCAPHDAPPRDAASGDRGEPWPTLREMLPAPLRDGFSSTMAEHPSQRRLEVQPRGGTLVVFEAAVVPHEVTAVVAGERLALFGFLAEERTIPTAWRDPEGEESDCGPWFHDGWAVTDC